MANEHALPYLSQEDRLEAYNLIIGGCHHLWSKNKLQEEKVLAVVRSLVRLAQADPYFVAHLTSWAIKKDSKDLKLMALYANSLSSADGSPFSPGSKYHKPNLRMVSAAAVQELNPKLAHRLLELQMMKYGIDGMMNHSRHFPTFLVTALKRYLKYRENNLYIVKGIKKSGLGNTYANIYRRLHMAPTDEVASILRWQQKGKDIEMAKSDFDFKGMEPLEIAKTIREKKLPVLSTIGALEEITPVVAVALLEQATGDQAIILRKTFDEAGVLKDKEVKALFEQKILESKNAVDRVESFSEKLDADLERTMKQARAEVRKQATDKIGKVFIHLDLSPSMEPAIDVAKKHGATIAEMVANPAENFGWGWFNDRKKVLPNPEEFVEDAFKSILYGVRCDGMTDCFLLYPEARKMGADVDVFISDGCHNVGDMARKIRNYHRDHPNAKKPKAMVWVDVKGRGPGYSDWERENLKKAYEDNEIPVAEMKPEALTGSALVSQAVADAMKGPIAVIDEILSTPLLKLPEWYYTL